MEDSCCRTKDRKNPQHPHQQSAPPHLLTARAAGGEVRPAGRARGGPWLAEPASIHFPWRALSGAEGSVYAVDFDPKAIAQLERRAMSKGYHRIIKARAASAGAIDFIESQSIHFVLAEGLLCCMTDHAGAIRQIRRILRPAGRAYLSVIKLFRADDPRAVSKETWTQLLSGFRLLDSGEGLLTRWALVGPGEGDPSAEPLFEKPVRRLGPAPLLASAPLLPAAPPAVMLMGCPFTPRWLSLRVRR